MSYIPQQWKGVAARSRRNEKEDGLLIELVLGRCRVGPDAAREIARKIEQQHGFWDFQERQAAA